METRKGHGARSEAVRDRAVVALLTAANLTDAAEQAGLDPSTLRGWLHADEGFRTKLQTAREAVFADAMHRIQALTSQAVATLSQLMESGPPAVRLGAAKSVLELAVHRHEAEAIEGRLVEIEQRLRDEAA